MLCRKESRRKQFLLATQRTPWKNLHLLPEPVLTGDAVLRQDGLLVSSCDLRSRLLHRCYHLAAHVVQLLRQAIPLRRYGLQLLCMAVPLSPSRRCISDSALRCIHGCAPGADGDVEVCGERIAPLLHGLECELQRRLPLSRVPEGGL